MILQIIPVTPPKQILKMRAIGSNNETVLMDNLEKSAPWQIIEDGPQFTLLPAWWYKDSQGEKLLLKYASLNQNGDPYNIAGFYVFDFTKKLYYQLRYPMTPINLLRLAKVILQNAKPNLCT